MGSEGQVFHYHILICNGSASSASTLGVYAKTPLGGPAQVLEYLSRYTHRTAIGNERIRAVNDYGVAFSVRADDHGANCNSQRLVRMEGVEFMRRFLLHVLPTGIKRIRHYGVLASACKGVKLAAVGVKPGVRGLWGLSMQHFRSHALANYRVCGG